ncbi:MAG: hypothetical protein EKK57_04915 [Proteobacteria bacterium]|nr:MAG: hypothetical protein EKK57_04915 [Pseudomonadota bacterium]
MFNRAKNKKSGSHSKSKILRPRPVRNLHVNEYRTQNDDGNWIFWYLYYDTINNQYYYHSSPEQLVDYDSINWKISDEKPAALDNESISPISSDYSVVGGEFTSNNFTNETIYEAPTENKTDFFFDASPSDSVSSCDSGTYDSGSSDSGSCDCGGSSD